MGENPTGETIRVETINTNNHKQLILLRHAKSSWEDTTVDDFSRTLNERGKLDAPLMGQRLVARGERPSLLVTSAAIRAKKTVRKIAGELGFPLEFIHREDTLYLASPDQILEMLQQQDDEFNNILLCAHNPGITELANRIPDVCIDNVPTCGLLSINTGTSRWQELDPQHWTLNYFDYPKNL